MKSELVIKQTLRTIAKAQQEYIKWTDTDWLSDGPEYLATTTIAREVQKLDEVAYVTLENNVRSAIKDAGGTTKGRLKRGFKIDGRFDVAVWNKQEPRGLFEVKTRVWGYWNLRDDLVKLCTSLNKAKRVRWGLVAYFIACEDSKIKSGKSAKEWIEIKTERTAEKAELHATRLSKRVCRYQSKIQGEGELAWTAEVLEIRRA